LKKAKKSSLRDIKKDIIVLNELMSITFNDFLEQFYRQSIITTIWEDLLRMKVSDSVTKGELLKDVEFFKSCLLDGMPTEDLVEHFSCPQMKGALTDIYAHSLSVMSKHKEEILKVVPVIHYKDSKRPTRKEVLRHKDALSMTLDYFVAGYVGSMRLKISHAEIMESVLDQYSDETRTLSDLKSWYAKWNVSKTDSSLLGQDLCNYLEVPNLYEESEQIEINLFRTIQDYINSLNSELHRGLAA